METKEKHFRKRDAILACLRQTDTHPSAEGLYSMLHRDHPDISLATVYRNLTLFKQQGLIAGVATVDGIERFDGNPVPHVHFVCTGCGSVSDLHKVMIPDSLQAQAQRDSGGSICDCRLTFSGLCRNCNHQK